MSLLTIVQRACRRIGITAPNAVISSTDLQIIQLLEIANEECEELATGASIGMSIDWEALQTEASFTTLAAESQGNIYTIAPGFKYIINDTIWNRSTKLPAYGGLNPRQWQAFKAWGVTNPYPQFRIRGDLLLLTPVPTAGQNYYFEYQSANWCVAADGVTTRNIWTADSDTCRLDERLVIQGVIWRWKQIKGLDYAEDFRKYQTRVTNAAARDGGKPDLDMGSDQSYGAGIVVPIGNWGV
jgi:hypothetical protein